jgi:hypothetical protein
MKTKFKYPLDYAHPGFIWISHPLKLEYNPPWPHKTNISKMSTREALSGVFTKCDAGLLRSQRKGTFYDFYNIPYPKD